MNASSWLVDTSSVDGIASASFPIVRRGYDPVEVQGFARAVSAEIVRLQAHIDELGEALQVAKGKASERITEATVAGFLGQETSRRLDAARETAAMLVAQAEERATRLRSTSEDEASTLLAVPREIIRPPRRWAEHAFNITHWTEMPRGGHFAAMEQPQLLVRRRPRVLPRFAAVTASVSRL